MHTQCPNCQTVFNVTTDQLRLAHGVVRCGHCMETFDGLVGLSKEELGDLETPLVEKTPAEDKLATVRQLGDRALLPAIPQSRWTVAVPDFPPQESASETDSANTVAEPYSATLANAFPEGLLETHSTQPDFQREDVTTPDEKPAASVSTRNEEISDEVIEQVGSIVPFLSTDSSEEEIGEPIDLETLRSFEAQVEASRHGNPLDDLATEQEGEEVAIDESPTDGTRTESSYPKILEDDIERLHHLAASAKLRKVFALSSIGLLLLVGLQYAWFMPEDMASRYPQTRNFLDTFCRHAGCTLAEQRDPDQVHVVSRDVRVHPKYEGALLVTAQLVNVANFVQPYPLMEFTLFNVNGQTIATRTFTPDEYVGRGVDIGAGMAPSVPTQIELDLLAPDEAAVSFEFRFL